MPPAIRTVAILVATLVLLAAGLAVVLRAGEPQAGTAPQPDLERPLPSAGEARGRAELLHEAFHATLQAIHHQYFRADEGIAIPAVTLKSVFREIGRRQQVEIRWLAVNAQAMNLDHQPRGEFEQDAAKALAAGRESYERVASGVYRRAGSIVLQSECLKCHEPTRTSVQERVAGLIITMPVKAD